MSSTAPALPRADLHADKMRLWMMMALTFVTGVVDAVGFLGFDHVFVGNMTGNIVIIGMALAGGDNLPVIGPVVALGTFTAGAFFAGIFLRRRRKQWGWAVSLLLLMGATGMALLAFLYLCAAMGADSAALTLISSSTTAALMGAQAAVARSLAITDMTTVVVTSTLTSLASESFLQGGTRAVWNRRFGAIVLIFIGALIGALLLQLGPAVPLLLASGVTSAVALLGHALLYTRPTAVDS